MFQLLDFMTFQVRRIRIVVLLYKHHSVSVGSQENRAMQRRVVKHFAKAHRIGVPHPIPTLAMTRLYYAQSRS
jgi:hypothetical protein